MVGRSSRLQVGLGLGDRTSQFPTLGCAEVRLDQRKELPLLESNMGVELLAEFSDGRQWWSLAERQRGSPKLAVLACEARRSLSVDRPEQLPGRQ